MMKILEAERW
jgi:hypothetical protein